MYLFVSYRLRVMCYLFVGTPHVRRPYVTWNIKPTLQATFHLLSIDLTYINLSSIVRDENDEIQRFHNHYMACSVFCLFLISWWTERQVATCYKIWRRFNSKLNSRLSNERHSHIKASFHGAVIKWDLSVLLLYNIRNSVSGTVMKFLLRYM